MWETLAKELGKDAAVDVSMPKPRGEILIAGRFHAPGGKAVEAGQVTARFGQWEKRLFVFGDRFWKKTVTGWKISRISPLSSLDLAWENAFGGQSFPQNPVGKGADPVPQADGTIMIPLPNVEYPDHLVTSPSDRPVPACFGPLDITWPQRASKAGTYDDKWLRELFPGFAPDMDWTIFNMASEDQQMRGYLKGDEAFSFENMHPDRPLIEGRLPGLRPRCFIVHDRDGNREFMELGLHLDTAWFIPHAERVLLIYRGLHEVFDEDALDIETILLACESGSDEERPGEFYESSLARRLDEQTGYLQSLDESDLLPEGEPSSISELMEKGQDEPDIILENMKRRAEREKENADAMCREFGIDPSTLRQDTAQPPEINMQNLAELPEIIKKLEQEVHQKKEAMEEMAKKMAEEMGLDPEELILNARKRERRWPKFSAREMIDNFRAFGIEDPDKEAKLLELEQTISSSMRSAVHHLDPTFPRDREEIQEINRLILEAKETGASLRDEDLAYADLSHMDLSGMDFSYAYLEGADFSYTNLEGASFKGAVLVRCRFRRSNLHSADLEEANLGHSEMENTDFSGACLKNAILSETQIKQCNFQASDLEDADLSKARVTGCNFGKAVLRQATLMEAVLDKTDFRKADLSAANFLYSSLEKCDFSSAAMNSSTFVKVPAGSSSFAGADLSGSCLADACNFSNCDFSRTRAVDVNFRASDMSRVSFRQADVSGADFGQCMMQQADFSLAVAIGTSFNKADLTGATFRGANLMNAVMQQAVLHETDLTDSNLFSANFIKARFRNTDITLANTKRAFMEPWIKA